MSCPNPQPSILDSTVSKADDSSAVPLSRLSLEEFLEKEDLEKFHIKLIKAGYPTVTRFIEKSTTSTILNSYLVDSLSLF